MKKQNSNSDYVSIYYKEDILNYENRITNKFKCFNVLKM